MTDYGHRISAFDVWAGLSIATCVTGIAAFAWLYRCASRV